MFVYYFFVLNLLIVLIVTLEEIVILNLMKFHFYKKKIMDSVLWVTSIIIA